MEHFPPELSQRFTPQRTLRQWSDMRGGVWLVRQISDGQQLVVKTLPASNHTDHDVLQGMEGIQSSVGLLVFEEYGFAGYWHYEVSAYCNMGTLDSVYKTLPFHTWAETALEQLIAGLHTLHDYNIVHGDLKLSNILIHQPAEGSLQFFIADFDAASSLNPDAPRPSQRRLTVAYAAPEVIGSDQILPASDFWSLGMLLLTWQLQKRPFAELDDNEIRLLLATNWQPDFDAMTEQYWRALLGGLLEVSPHTRWGIDQCRRWLQHDTAIISEGLALSGEQAASTPLHVGSVVVFTATGLARALLEQWAATFIDPKHEQHKELLLWLQDELHREDLSIRLEQLIQNTQSLEICLLHYCHDIWPNMPAIWHGLELNMANLDATAHAALQVQNRLTWLLSLMESDCFNLYERWGYAEVAETGQRIQQFRRDYTEGWDAIIIQGAPEQARLTNERALPLLVRLACSREQQETLRQNLSTQLLNPNQILRRAPWYLYFGTDIEQMPLVYMLILQQLDEPSLLNNQHLNALNDMGKLDESALREGNIYFLWHQRLMENMVVTPGSTVHVLNPGDTHRPHGMTTLNDAMAERWQNLLHSLRRNVRQMGEAILTRMRHNQQTESGEDTPQAVVHEEPWLQVRMVSVAQQKGILRDALVFFEAYHAQVTWRIPEGSQGALKITPAGRIITGTLLKTRSLPQQGQMLLPLSDSSNIQLICKRRWWHLFKQITPPLRIFFAPKKQPVKVFQKLRKVCDNIIHSESPSNIKTLHHASLTTLHSLQPTHISSHVGYVHKSILYLRRITSRTTKVRGPKDNEHFRANAYLLWNNIKKDKKTEKGEQNG